MLPGHPGGGTMKKNGGLKPLTDKQLRKALLKRRSEHALLVNGMDAEQYRALEHRIYKLVRLADSRGLPFITDDDRDMLAVSDRIRRTVSVSMDYRENGTRIANSFSLQINGGEDTVHSILPEQSRRFLKKLRRMHPEMPSSSDCSCDISYSGTLSLTLDDGSVLCFGLSSYPIMKCEMLQDLVNRACSTNITVEMS